MVGWRTMPERDPATLHSIFGPVDERSGDVTYEGDLVVGSGASEEDITDVATIKMTIYDRITGYVIRKSENVLATDEGGAFVNGHFTMSFREADHPVLNQRLSFEDHFVLFEVHYTFKGKSKTKPIQFIIRVRNIGKIKGAS